MSLEYEEQMIDRISSKSPSTNKSKQEKELERLQNEKQNLMMKQNREYLENLFHEHKTAPLNIRNIQISNSQAFRDEFLATQFRPLLLQNIVTLENFLDKVEVVSKNLIKLNVVENLLVSLNPIPKTIFNKNKPSIDLIPVFNIVPIKKFYAKTGTNIGNGEGDGYIQFQLKNLFGGAENLVFDAITGTKTHSSYLINYNQPLLNNANYITENLAYLNTRKLDWINSEVKSKGFTNKIYTQFDSPINHELIMENCWKVLSNVCSKSNDILVQSGSNFKSSIIYNWKFDTRDNGHLPTRGKFFRVGLEYNGLFKFNHSPFFKAVLQSQMAYKLDKFNSLILTNKSGLLYSLNGPSYILDRFFIGGPNDVRSFTLNGLGPKDYNSSIGGDVFLNGGLSLISKFPKVNEESNFKIHNFVNFGKLFQLDKSKSAAEVLKDLTKEFSASYGFGILYNHPVARFELNFVLPLSVHERDYVRKGLQYGIGISFL